MKQTLGFTDAEKNKLAQLGGLRGVYVVEVGDRIPIPAWIEGRLDLLSVDFLLSKNLSSSFRKDHEERMEALDSWKESGRWDGVAGDVVTIQSESQSDLDRDDIEGGGDNQQDEEGNIMDKDIEDGGENQVDGAGGIMDNQDHRSFSSSTFVFGQKEIRAILYPKEVAESPTKSRKNKSAQFFDKQRFDKNIFERPLNFTDHEESEKKYKYLIPYLIR